MLVTIGIMIHQFPILTEAGVSRSNAAWLLSVFGIAGIAGKLVTGTLLDRMHARLVGGISLESTTVACPLLLASVRSTELTMLARVISGYAAGTQIQLCGYLAARYAGTRDSARSSAPSPA